MIDDNWVDGNDVGKMLLMSIAILSSEGKFRNMTPDGIFEEIKDLSNRVFHENEWNGEQKIKNRIRKIDSLGRS